MSESVKLVASDGNELDGYVARPEGTAVGSVVVVQEIFGVNSHIRSVADAFAKEGYLAMAPALFDRIEKNVQLSYEGEDMQRAFGFYGKLDPATALLDVAAGFKFVEEQQPGRVAVVGFCYGGFMSWLSATRGAAAGMKPACAVGYYPGGIGSVAQEQPQCPVMLHVGSSDSHIGPEQVEAVRAAHPEVQIFMYEGAEHGFNCDQRASFNPAASQLARKRTLEFLGQQLG